jgi:RNA polymerase sigma factor (sigma-70 family)
MLFRGNPSKLLADQSDEQLIAAYRASRNARYTAELFSRYLHLVHGVCMKYVYDPDDRSDLVMHIFEKVLNDLPAAEVSNFNSWLYSISRNECVSWLRHRDRHATVFTENWEDEKKSGALVMENDASERLYIEEDEIEGRLEEALLQLDERQSACIRLFFFEEKSYKDISDITGFEVSEVKSYLQNGKRRLRGLLSP